MEYLWIPRLFGRIKPIRREPSNRAGLPAIGRNCFDYQSGAAGIIYVRHGIRDMYPANELHIAFASTAGEAPDSDRTHREGMHL